MAEHADHPPNGYEPLWGGRYDRFLEQYPPTEYRIEITHELYEKDLIELMLRADPSRAADMVEQNRKYPIYKFHAKLIPHQSDSVLVEAHAVRQIYGFKDFEIGETAARQRVVAAAGFNGSLIQSDEQADWQGQKWHVDKRTDQGEELPPEVVREESEFAGDDVAASEQATSGASEDDVPGKEVQEETQTSAMTDVGAKAEDKASKTAKTDAKAKASDKATEGESQPASEVKPKKGSKAGKKSRAPRGQSHIEGLEPSGAEDIPPGMIKNIARLVDSRNLDVDREPANIDEARMLFATVTQAKPNTEIKLDEIMS